MPTTPNMNMTLPTVGVTVDPTWASNLNDALTNKVDLHDHSTGLGVPVPTAGININADLSFQSNDATNLRSLSLNNNVSTLPSGDIRAIYASGGNLYYNNNSGVAVRITTGSSLDTGSLALNVWELTELAGNLTIPSNASYVFINTSTASARVITLPTASAVTAGRYFIIKDKTGSAATNNITITPAGADTIDGAASSTTVTSAYGSLTLISDGVTGWLTNASVGGFIQLGGDLLGTGSTTLAPRVSSLTGIAGLVTMANNTALNTRNFLNNTNINLAKINTSNVILLGDSAFQTTVQGTTTSLVGSTAIVLGTAGNASVTSATADVVVTAADDIAMTAADTLQMTATAGSASLIATAGTAALSAIAADVSITAGTDISLAATDDFSLTATDDGYISAGDTLILAGNTVTLKGALFLPTKAVVGPTTYTVDTTSNDVVMFCDSTSGAISINLPAASNGRKLIIQDVAGIANTNNITLVRNGSDTIQGVASNYVMDADFQGVTLIAYSGASWFIIGT